MTLPARIADKLRQAISGDERVKESMYQIDIDDALELTCDIEVSPIVDEFDDRHGVHCEQLTATYWQIKSGILYDSETDASLNLTDEELTAIETILNR